MGRILEAIRAALSAIGRAVTKLRPVWERGRLVVRPVTEWVQDAVLSAACAGGAVTTRTARLALDGVRATPGAAWGVAKLATKAVTSPVVLAGKGAASAARVAAGTVGGVLGAFLGATGGRTGGAHAPAPGTATAAVDKAKAALEGQVAEERAVAASMPESLAVRRIARLSLLPTEVPRAQAQAMMATLQPRTLAWLRTLNRDELRLLSTTQPGALARHLAGTSRVSGLPSMDVAAAREREVIHARREREAVATNAFAARVAANRDARTGRTGPTARPSAHAMPVAIGSDLLQ